jgi:cation:H+ antiporter
MNLMHFAFFVLGFVILIKGADLLVNGASAIARRFHVSDLAIGLTVVAFGTSTPELFVNVVASLKGNTEIAVGNVVGSNIFNIFFVLGISSTIKPLPFQTSGNLDILMGIVTSLMLFLFMFTGKKRSLDRWEGSIFICGYIVYVAFLVLYFNKST